MNKLFIFLGFVTSTLSILGVDVSSTPPIDALKCLRDEGRTFIIGRAWKSYGAFDSNVLQTIKNSEAAGFSQSEIGVYMFPCFSQEKSAESQIRDMVAGLGDAHYSSIWLDMETNPSPGCGWSQDFNLNCQFTIQLVNAAKASAPNKKIGIYASNYMWRQIMGGADKCFQFNQLPLWYAHYDMVPAFTDFSSFGGWATPYIKQYKGTTALCNASVDLNFK